MHSKELWYNTKNLSIEGAQTSSTIAKYSSEKKPKKQENHKKQTNDLVDPRGK